MILGEGIGNDNRENDNDKKFEYNWNLTGTLLGKCSPEKFNPSVRESKKEYTASSHGSVALCFVRCVILFNLFLFWVPALVKTEIMKVWVRKKHVTARIPRYTGSPWRIVCMNSVRIWHGSHVGAIAAYTGRYITTSSPWSPFFPSVSMGKGKKKDSSK